MAVQLCGPTQLAILSATIRKATQKNRAGGTGPRSKGLSRAVRAPHRRSLLFGGGGGMASRKLLLSLTAGSRGIQSRVTSRLLSPPNLPGTTASRPLVAVSATTKLSEGSPPASLPFSYRAISSTCIKTQSSGDAPSPASSEHRFVFLDLFAVFTPCCSSAYSSGVSLQSLVRGDWGVGGSLKHTCSNVRLGDFLPEFCARRLATLKYKLETLLILSYTCNGPLVHNL
jgi:hypothetical protein